MDKQQRSLMRRFDRQAITQLRAEVTALAEKLERTEQQLDDARAWLRCAENEAELYREALKDNEFSTHRCMGMNKAGEMMVVDTAKGATC